MAAIAPVLLLAAGPAAPLAIDLPGERLFPENLTIIEGGTAFVGSVSGGVMRVSLRTGKVEQWIEPGAYGSGSVFGVMADPINGMLWTCSNDLAFADFSVPGADKGSYLKGFDLSTGEGRISLKLPGRRGFCNDIAVARDGTVYVTDTNPSYILRWRKGDAALENWFLDPAFDTRDGGLDGIAIGADGNLYVNNYRSHVLARVEVKGDGTPGKVTVLRTSRPLDVPDGLRPIGGMRFAQAEGSGKIAIVTISGDNATVETLVEGLSSASAVDRDGDRLWYVQPELNYVFNPAMRDKTPPLPFRVTSVALPRSQ